MKLTIETSNAFYFGWIFAHLGAQPPLLRSSIDPTRSAEEGWRMYHETFSAKSGNNISPAAVCDEERRAGNITVYFSRDDIA